MISIKIFSLKFQSESHGFQPGMSVRVGTWGLGIMVRVGAHGLGIKGRCSYMFGFRALESQDAVKGGRLECC